MGIKGRGRITPYVMLMFSHYCGGEGGGGVCVGVKKIPSYERSVGVTRFPFLDVEREKRRKEVGVKFVGRLMFFRVYPDECH